MKTNNKLKTIGYILGTSALLTVAAHAQLDDWKTIQGEKNTITDFFQKVTRVLMYVMAVVSIVITVLAFKGLAGQGDWRSFWNKIAGAIGMFAVPTIMNWLLTQG